MTPSPPSRSATDLSRTGIVILVPTYNRPGPLVWSLLSALRQQVPGTALAARKIVVLNNGTPPGLVERAVEVALLEVGDHPWSVSVVNREPPLDPQLSWYGGLDEHCADGDVAFLHGDDDLLLPGAAALRASAIVESGASCLLSRSHGGLFFDGSDAERAYLRPIPKPPIGPLAWRPLTAATCSDFTTAFIGNHCYRAGSALRSAVATGMAWLRTLPLEGVQQLAMLPYFLPIAVADQDLLAGTDASCCIRGQSTDEVARRRFGHSTWRPGVLYAASLHVLERGPLASRADLRAHRNELRRLAALWYLPTLAATASRLEWARVQGTALCHPTRPGQWGALLRGGAMVVRAATGTQALRARLLDWRTGLSRRDLLARIGLDSGLAA